MTRILAKREKTILYATIGILVFSLLFNFLIAPVMTKNDALNKEINIARVKLKKYLRLLAQKDSIQEKYKQFSSALKLPGQEDAAVSALSELESLANNANIRIIDLRPESASRSAGSYREILIDLRAEGNMEGYLKFLYNLENSFSLLHIRAFRLSAKPNSAILEGSFSVSQPFIE